MNRAALPLVLVVCLSLLGAQASGLHMHVGDHGYHGAPHATHSHSGGKDPHDHEHDTDVNVLDLGTIASKHLLLPLAVAFSILLTLEALRHVVPRYTGGLSSRHRRRWRPPLRAPPHPLADTH